MQESIDADKKNPPLKAVGGLSLHSGKAGGFASEGEFSKLFLLALSLSENISAKAYKVSTTSFSSLVIDPMPCFGVESELPCFYKSKFHLYGSNSSIQKDYEMKWPAGDNRLTKFSLDFFRPFFLGDLTPHIVWFSFFESGSGGEIDLRFRFFIAESVKPEFPKHQQCNTHTDISSI